MEDKKFVTTKESLFRREYADEKNEVKMLRLIFVHFLDLYDVDSWAIIYVDGTKAE